MGCQGSEGLESMANTCTRQICDTLIEMMSNGCTQDEVCAAVGVNPSTFWRWRQPNGEHYDEEFAQAYEVAKLKQYSWWLKKGRENLMDGKDFNTRLFALFMANIFRWRSVAAQGR
jgi:hypothetical protein